MSLLELNKNNTQKYHIRIGLWLNHICMFSEILRLLVLKTVAISSLLLSTLNNSFIIFAKKKIWNQLCAHSFV